MASQGVHLANGQVVVGVALLRLEAVVRGSRRRMRRLTWMALCGTAGRRLAVVPACVWQRSVLRLPGHQRRPPLPVLVLFGLLLRLRGRGQRRLLQPTAWQALVLAHPVVVPRRLLRRLCCTLPRRLVWRPLPQLWRWLGLTRLRHLRLGF